MLFININPTLADRLIGALCDTLLYSLLLGVVLAAVAGLIVVFTRKATSALRYNLLIGALVLFTAGTCITFAAKFGHVASASPSVVKPAIAVNNPNVVILDDVAPSINNGLIENITAWLNSNHNTIVLVWFLIICAKGIQLATGLQGVYRLKNTNMFSVTDEWQTKLADMSARLGIKQKIAMLESGLAKVPMVIGHLKPVVLIPIGLLTALTTDEVEAILMHELAHIRRRDYLVNLLQSLVEILFFFNPAVLWVSQLIKTERENCCDDMALAQNTNKSSYIMALVSAEEYQQTITPAYAMGFPGQQNHLLGRVKRIVNNRNHSLDGFGKTLLAICLVAAGICFSAFAEKENIKKAMHAVVSVIKHPKPNLAERKKLDAETHKLDDETAKLDSQTAALDSYTSELDSKEPGVPPVDTTAIPTSKLRIYKPEQVGEGTELQLSNGKYDTYLYKEHGKLYQLNAIEGKVKSVQLDGNNLSTDEVKANQAAIDRILTKIDGDVQKSKVASLSSLGHLSGSSYKSVLAPSMSQMQAKLTALNAQVALNGGRPINTVTDSIDVHADIKVAAPTKIAVSPKVAPVAKVAATVHPTYYPQNNYSYSPYKPDTAGYVKSRENYKTIADRDKKMSENAINDMINDGLITTRDDLSFSISTKELIINYKRMPDDVFQKYKAKYVKAGIGGDWKWMYHYDDTKKVTTNSVTKSDKN